MIVDLENVDEILKKSYSSTSSCGSFDRYGSGQAGNAGSNFHSRFEDYMEYGSGAARHGIGFHLPHRSKNEEIDIERDILPWD